MKSIELNIEKALYPKAMYSHWKTKRKAAWKCCTKVRVKEMTF